MLLVFFVAAATPVAIMGWKDLYTGFLETTQPEIKVLELPRGVGLTPVSVRLKISDPLSGLDEVVIRVSQRGRVEEKHREVLNGAKEKEIEIPFPGRESSLEEGKALLEIRAFDRSIWSNRREMSIPLTVDYRKPALELITRQHNARRGGSQLVFYRAIDEDLAISGVKVGDQTFIGYPATSLDQSFDNQNLFVAVYALDLNRTDTSKGVRLFAEDRAGNAVSMSFYNKIRRWSGRVRTVPVSEEALRKGVADLATNNFSKLEQIAAASGKALEYTTAAGSIERLIEQFALVNEGLRTLNIQEFRKHFNNSRYDRYWDGAFIQPDMRVFGEFGDRVKYTYQGQLIGRSVRYGYELGLAAGETQVPAFQDGIVAFSDNLGVFGRVVGVDHGLGLISVYGRLGSAAVSPGQEVKAGDQVGTIGPSGLGLSKHFYLELRVHGIPVDIREWWDRSWFYAHVIQKEHEAKRALGIPVYRNSF